MKIRKAKKQYVQFSKDHSFRGRRGFRDFSLTLRARCSIFFFAAGLFGVLFCLTLEVPILRKSGTKCIFER